MVVEQNYGEMNARYQEVMAAKQRMESEVMALQASLDAERNARSQEAQHAMELNGEAVELGVGGGGWQKRAGGVRQKGWREMGGFEWRSCED